MNITKKILLATLPFILLLGVLGLYLGISSLKKQNEEGLQTFNETMLKDKKEKVQDLVDTTFEILVSQYNAAHDTEKVAEAYKSELQSVVNLAFTSIEAVYKRSDLSEFEKKNEAKRIVEQMRYGGGNYLWINDMQPAMVMHPIKPALNGNDLAGFKDPNGKHLFVAMKDVCKTQGDGFVDYMWPKPGEEKPVAKLSYVKLFEPWGWIVGTGVYLQAAEDRFKDEAKKQIAALRFGPEKNDYFFIVDKDNKMVMHPIKPNLDGSDMSDFRDAEGKLLFREMVAVATSKQEGFVDYMWEKAGEDQPQEKLSFVKFFSEWGWVIGTGIYIDDIKQSMVAQQQKADQLVDRQKTLILATTLVTFLLVTFLIIYMTLRISAPIRIMNNMLQDVAEGEGDLTKRIPVVSSDETGQMAGWFNLFVEKLQGMMGYISQESIQINKSSNTLSGISRELANNAQATSDKSDSVAAAVEQMSANMNSVAGAMEETSANVNVVATAVDQMTATIEEIAETSEKARSITEQTVTQSGKASASVDELGSAATEITGVLETISEISEQVDLLALNATIEAARAGEAGKGFAVVANEIKDLANQTAEATDQIKERINSIQKTTTATVAEIRNISSVVGENADVVNAIATAVEEQSVTAREISHNVGEISLAVQEVNTNVAESSAVASEIASDIAEVNQASRGINKSSQNIDTNSQELRRLAKALEKLVSTYKF
jgi:methyl-accepting chemotaxis protein